MKSTVAKLLNMQVKEQFLGKLFQSLLIDETLTKNEYLQYFSDNTLIKDQLSWYARWFLELNKKEDINKFINKFAYTLTDYEFNSYYTHLTLKTCEENLNKVNIEALAQDKRISEAYISKLIDLKGKKDCYMPALLGRHFNYKFIKKYHNLIGFKNVLGNKDVVKIIKTIGWESKYWYDDSGVNKDVDIKNIRLIFANASKNFDLKLLESLIKAYEDLGGNKHTLELSNDFMMLMFNNKDDLYTKNLLIFLKTYKDWFNKNLNINLGKGMCAEAKECKYKLAN